MARIIIETDMGQRFEGTYTGEAQDDGQMKFCLVGKFDDGRDADLTYFFNLDDSDDPKRRPLLLIGEVRGREVRWEDPDESRIDHPNWAEWCLLWDLKCAHDAVESVFSEG